MKLTLNYIPLIWISPIRLLVCTRDARVCVYHLTNTSLETIGMLPLSAKERILMLYSFSARMLRLINMTACRLNDTEVIVAFRSRFFALA